MSSKKGLFTLFITFILVLGVTAAAFANPGKGNAKPKPVKWKSVELNDISSHWAEQSIREMVRQGVVSGYPDFSFKPNAPVSKYEALIMISRAAGYSMDTDQSWDNRLEDCLENAEDEGILTENEAEDFKGWLPAKRFEVAVWAIRALDETDLDEDELLAYRDQYEIPMYARPYVKNMYKKKYMVGYQGNNFRPNQPITRAELSAIIYRILQSDWEDDRDYSDLKLTKLNPADGSKDVDPDTTQLIATFNQNIEADDEDDLDEGITVENVSEDEDLEISGVTIRGRTLTITLEDSLEEDQTYRVIIEEDLIAAANDQEETFKGISGSEWEFSTGDEESSDFTIEDLTPEDGDNEVESTEVLKATFNHDIEVVSGKSLLNAVKVYNRDEEENVQIRSVKIDGDTLVITLEEELDGDDRFEVTIRGGYIQSEDDEEVFDGIDGDEHWSFTTE